MLRELILKNRSYRRFYQDRSVDADTIKSLIDLARLSPSARNVQALKYIISCDPVLNEKLFYMVSWAGYLEGWGGPPQGERPAAYIVQMLDTSIAKDCLCDDGIAAQSILLGAVERGLGGCILGSVKKQETHTLLNLPEKYRIIQLIALGVPKEQIELEPLPASGNYRYWRDEKQIHHVPKRSLDEIIAAIYLPA